VRPFWETQGQKDPNWRTRKAPEPVGYGNPVDSDEYREQFVDNTPLAESLKKLRGGK
jgi:hypothetical protein